MGDRNRFAATIANIRRGGACLHRNKHWSAQIGQSEIQKRAECAPFSCHRIGRRYGPNEVISTRCYGNRCKTRGSSTKDGGLQTRVAGRKNSGSPFGPPDPRLPVIGRHNTHRASGMSCFGFRWAPASASNWLRTASKRMGNRISTSRISHRVLRHTRLPGSCLIPSAWWSRRSNRWASRRKRCTGSGSFNLHASSRRSLPSNASHLADESPVQYAWPGKAER